MEQSSVPARRMTAPHRCPLVGGEALTEDAPLIPNERHVPLVETRLARCQGCCQTTWPLPSRSEPGVFLPMCSVVPTARAPQRPRFHSLLPVRQRNRHRFWSEPRHGRVVRAPFAGEVRSPEARFGSSVRASEPRTLPLPAPAPGSESPFQTSGCSGGARARVAAYSFKERGAPNRRRTPQSPTFEGRAGARLQTVEGKRPDVAGALIAQHNARRLGLRCAARPPTRGPKRQGRE
jgi:hypothetical protein